MPEAVDIVAIRLGDSRQEKSEQDGEQHQADHLGVQRGVDHVRGHDALDRIEHAGLGAVLHAGGDFTCIGRERQRILHRLAVAHAGLDGIHEHERDQHRDQRGQHVEAQGLRRPAGRDRGPVPSAATPVITEARISGTMSIFSRLMNIVPTVSNSGSSLKVPNGPVGPDRRSRDGTDHHGDQNGQDWSGLGFCSGRSHAPDTRKYSNTRGFLSILALRLASLT